MNFLAPWSPMIVHRHLRVFRWWPNDDYSLYILEKSIKRFESVTDIFVQFYALKNQPVSCKLQEASVSLPPYCNVCATWKLGLMRMRGHDQRVWIIKPMRFWIIVVPSAGTYNCFQQGPRTNMTFSQWDRQNSGVGNNNDIPTSQISRGGGGFLPLESLSALRYRCLVTLTLCQ